MNTIFLSAPDLKKPLTLEPKEDTLYFVSKSAQENTISLDLSTPGVQAFLVGLFRTDTEQNFTIHQTHSAPYTVSHVLLKTVLQKGGTFSYQGNLHIKKEAVGTVASQEARGLLLGPGAQFKAIPSLEILPKEVRCTHKASAAPLNQDYLFALATKGLKGTEAETLLEQAFLQSAFETLSSLGVDKKTLTHIKEHHA